MALFGGQRDAKFLAAINSELINAIIDTEIEFYKLVVESSDSNMYGESESKSYYDSILIPCLITKDDKNANMDDYGHTYTRSSKFAISRDILVKSDFYPEVGDIVFWDNEYFEVDNVDANQYFFCYILALISSICWRIIIASKSYITNTLWCLSCCMCINYN